MSGWHDTTFDVFPDEGQLVEVPNNGGTTLVYKNGMWWVPDMSMYVYYSPKYWKAVPTTNERLY